MSIPSTSNAIILSTGVELIGELCDWLSERPNHIGNFSSDFDLILFLVLCVNWLLSIPLSTENLKPWATSLQKLTSKGYTYLRDYFEQINSVLENIETSQGSLVELEDAAQEIIKGMFYFHRSGQLAF